MTDTLTDLIRELRQRAKVYAMVGDKTPSGLMTRAADALESRNTTIDRSTAPPTFCMCHPGRPMAGCPNPRCQS